MLKQFQRLSNPPVTSIPYHHNKLLIFGQNSTTGQCLINQLSKHDIPHNGIYNILVF